jgi:hypothetical protein
VAGPVVWCDWELVASSLGVLKGRVEEKNKLVRCVEDVWWGMVDGKDMDWWHLLVLPGINASISCF